MWTSKYTETKEIKETKEALDKSFANIRFVAVPPEELKALNIDLKDKALFLEVSHGTQAGTLNKQWIPLFLQPEPKIPVDQKTHGEKVGAAPKASNTACFDTKAIADFIYKHVQKNKLAPFVLPTPGATLGKKLTLCIPILGGECQLAFTPEGNVCINRVPNGLDLTIETPGSIETGADLLCGAVCLSGKSILNTHSLIVETLMVKTEQPPKFGVQLVRHIPAHYSFYNRGHIAITKGDFTFIGEGFSHTAGTVTTNKNILITAFNINLIAQMVAGQNITLHQDGGVCVVSNAVKAAGELGFYLSEGMTITEARTVPGSLRYIVLYSATKPLLFLADQTAESGYISIDIMHTPLIIGDNEHSVTLKSRGLVLDGQRLVLYKGRLLSEVMRLGAKIDIVLGREEAAQAAILCLGPISMRADVIRWNQLEMMCGGDLHVTKKFSWSPRDRSACSNRNLVNTSNQVHIKGDAIWEIPTRHQLLVKQDATSAEALTKPSTVIIEGKLSIGNHALDIFASQLSCGKFEGTPDKVKNESFIPFTTMMQRRKTGEDRIKHKFHGDDVHEKFADFPTVVLGTPINASFSIGSNVKVSIPHIDISGILSAISIEINGIQQGLIGQFNACVSLAPMVFKPSKGQVSLLNYFDPTLLYEISPGGETVFKSVFPVSNLAPELPRMLLRADGTLGRSPSHIRRLFPREKEAHLLTKAMLGEFGRGFLNKAANTPRTMMQYLEANTMRYSQTGQKLITIQSPGVLSVAEHTEANNGLSVVKTDCVGNALSLAEPSIPEPCIVDTLEMLVFEDGHSEEVLSSVVLFPKHYDNRRLRSGAGCMFALGDITFSGVPGSELHIRGNIDAKGLVTYQNLETVSRTRNTWTRNETITQVSNQKSLLGKNETTVSFQQVGITELQPGNEMVAGRGAHFKDVKNIYLSGARDQLGPEGLVVENADTFVDAAIVRNKIGAAVAVNQKGFLGLGGSSTSVTPVLQEAIGSEITTPGPVHIQAQYGQFDATQFRVTEGGEGESKLEFEISELHFHKLLRAVEAQNKASEALLLSALKEQARTAKRKSRQGTTLLLVSIPVSCYFGGLITSYLEQVMGVTISATATAAATASVAETATIVGLSGMGAGIVGAAIQGQPLAKAAIHGALFSVLGHGIEKAPVLAAESQLVKDVARGVGAGSASAILNHGNILESALIGGASAGVASTVVPGSYRDLSVPERVSKAVVETAAAAALSGGANNLPVNLASAALGAAIGETMSDLGSKHGQQLGGGQPVNVTTALTSTSTSTASSSSSTLPSSGTRTDPTATPSSRPARRNGLVGSDFERELNAVHQSARDLFFDAEMERSLNHTTKGFWSMPAENNAFEMKDLFDTQPVLLWSAPTRLNRTLERTFSSKSTAAQDSRQSKSSHSSQYLNAFGRGDTSVLDMIVGAAELSALSSAMEENGSALMPIQSGFGAMALRALFGDHSPAVLAWQQQNRKKAPVLARESDALQEVKPLQVAKGFGRGVKDSVVAACEFLGEEAARFRLGERTKIGSIVKASGTFLGEEAARFQLGERTKIGSIVNPIGTFLGEEAARITLHEETQTKRFARVVDTFVYEEAARFRLGEETKTQALIFTELRKLCEIPAEELTYHLGKVGGDILTGYGIARGLKLTYKAAEWGVGGGFSELREFAAARRFRSPIVLEYDPNSLCSGIPLDLFKLRMPWTRKDILSETARLYPLPLFKHEEAIIAQWTIERLRLLEMWKAQNLSVVNPKMRRLLNKCSAQLRDHMTPDDLAAIMKEQRGVKIPKIKGRVYDHINNEWQQAQRSFEKALHGPWSGNSAEAQILNERFGELSRLWDRFEKLMEKAKCNPEMKKLKFLEKP